MNQELSQLLLVFLASIPRVAAVFMILPIFGRKVLQSIVRNEFILILALFVFPAALSGQPDSAIAVPLLLVIMVKETLLGVTLGFFLATVFWVAENVGYLIDLQTGTNNLQIYDPINEHDEGPTSALLLYFAIAMMFAGGGFLLILSVIFESFIVWPVFEMSPKLSEAFGQIVSARADSLFVMTVQFAAPIVILLLLIELGLGLLNRSAQHLDVYSAAMPIKSLVAFFVLLIFLSYIYESLGQFLGADCEALTLLSGALR